MKSRRLTETDLANIAFQSPDAKRLRLSSIIKPKRILGSYEPFRSAAGDALNQQFPFFEDEHEATPLGKLEEVVSKACKGNSELLKMNLAVARATHNHAVQEHLTAERLNVRPITLAFGHTYTFGMPLVLRSTSRAFAAFPDLRRTQPLSPSGCRFVFSMMHERWRANYPDLAELGLAIWRYQNNFDRTVRPIESLGSALVGYDRLVADVAETYEILHELLHKEAERKRRGTGPAGPLFGAG